MVRVGAKDLYERWKPEGFKEYMTIAEVCAIVKRDKRRLTQLEKQGRIPAPIRVKAGRHRVRLYSQKDLKRIQAYFATAKPGRPKGGTNA